MALYTSKGTISGMSEVQSGTSQSGYQWQNMNLILDIPGFQGTITKQVFRVSGDSVEDVLKFKIGDKVEVSWSMYAREWNGKMFNNVDLVKIALQAAAQAQAAAPAPAPQVRGVAARARAAQATPVQFTQEELAPHIDDLPFA